MNGIRKAKKVAMLYSEAVPAKLPRVPVSHISVDGIDKRMKVH